MRSFDHCRLAERLVILGTIPDDDEFACWIEAKSHLSFLTQNVGEDELAVYAAGACTYFTSVLIPRNKLENSSDIDELLNWSVHGGEFRSAYVTAGGETWLEENNAADGCPALDGSKHLFFWRTFEGWKGKGSRYLELLQEFAHTAGVHWREEYEAFIKFDDAGDVDPVFSVSRRGQDYDGFSFASVKRTVLDDFLAAGDFVLLR